MKTNLNLPLIARTASLLTVAATTHSILPARANVMDARFTGTGDFSFGVEYMTDLDQRRGGLPNDGGAYCVPTSAMNLFAYAANFGCEGLLPGPGVWEGATGHNLITAHLLELGGLMSTDPEGGTTLTGQSNGFNGWLDQNNMASMPVVTMARDDNYWPTIDVAAFMGTAGAVVNFAYGRYEWTPGPGGEIWLTNRNMGHSVTLQRAVATNGQQAGARQIGIHNPSGANSDDELFSNSLYYAQQFMDAANIPVWLDLDDDGDLDESLATSLFPPDPDADDNRYRLLDSVTGLYPVSGMSFTTVELNAQFAGGGLGFVSSQQPAAHRVPAGSSLVSVIPHPELHSALAIVRGPSGDALYQMPHANPRASRLLDLPTGSRFLVLGYGQAVYAVTPTGITGLRVRSRDASILGSVPLPTAVRATPIEAATYNEATDELLLVSGTGARLHVFDAATLRLKKSYALQSPLGAVAVRTASVIPTPTQTPTVSGTLATSAASPRSVVLALAQGTVAQLDYSQVGSPNPSGLSTVALSVIPLPGVKDALSADVDSGRRLYVSDRTSGLVEYTADARGRWTRTTNPFYLGSKLLGRKFIPFRSHGNLRPEIHDQPEWRHIVDDAKE